MTDKELLELAAKAAGIANDNYSTGRSCQPENKPDDWYYWNPLMDDGDALRLAVKLELDIFYSCISVRVIHRDDEGTGAVIRCKGKTPQIEDPCAATRRAIVRAAAEIGRNK